MLNNKCGHGLGMVRGVASCPGKCSRNVGNGVGEKHTITTMSKLQSFINQELFFSSVATLKT